MWTGEFFFSPVRFRVGKNDIVSFNSKKNPMKSSKIGIFADSREKHFVLCYNC